MVEAREGSPRENGVERRRDIHAPQIGILQLLILQLQQQLATLRAEVRGAMLGSLHRRHGVCVRERGDGGGGGGRERMIVIGPLRYSGDFKTKSRIQSPVNQSIHGDHQ